MKKRLLFTGLAVISLLAGCSEQEPMDPINDYRVRLFIDGPSSRVSSNALTTTFDTGDKIAITSSGLKPDMNQDIFTVTAEGSLESEKAFYYNGNQSAKIYAHYPVEATTSDGVVSFTVPTTQSSEAIYNGADFMTAVAMGSIHTDGGAVSLKFQHRLSLLKIVWKGSSTATDVELKSVLPTVNWAYAKDSVFAGGDATDILMWKKAADTQEYWALIPSQTIEKGTKLLHIYDGDKVYPYTPTVNLDFTDKQVKKITLNTDENKVEAIATGITIENWTDTGDVTNGTMTENNTSQLWLEYLEGIENGTESRLANFSYAGYKSGEESIPDVDYTVFDVTTYGAVADDRLNDREALESAIAAAQAKGSGIIYFPAGRYHLRPSDATNASITISGSNIILRGAGSGENGTELFMEYPNEPETTDALWSCPALIRFQPASSTDTQLATITADAARGSHSVEVSSTSGLSVGQRVFLNLKNNDTSLISSELSPYEVQSDWTDLLNNGIQVTEYHEITAISGNTVTFKAPLLHKVESQWGWTLHEHSCCTGTGVEDIAFVGNFQDTFVHHQDATHDSGYKMLGMLRQVDSWVRRCRFTDMSEALSVQKSANVSVFSCDITGHQGHSAIRSEASSRVFIGAIDDQSGQYHSAGVSKTAIGTVLWRNKTTGESCFEAHSYQPRVTLLDACEGPFIANHAGGDTASAPNHLGELVLWNYLSTAGSGTFDLWCSNNRFLMPIIAGFRGSVTFDSAQVTIDESHGAAVYPESLYEAQLTERLGYLPQWLQELK